MTSSKKFICTGEKMVDVTVRASSSELVMVGVDVLNYIYQQGFIDCVSDTIGEPVFLPVQTMEAEDEHA